MADDRTTGVYPLDQLHDLKVAENEIDPRGWDVYSLDGELLGEVKQLLVDVAALKVRYLDVELTREVIDRDNRRVLFPVGTARLDERLDRVFVDAATATLSAVPAYASDGTGPVSRDYEKAVLSTVSPAGTTAGTDADPGEITAAELDFYTRDEFDTDRFYGSRRGASEAG